MKRLAHVLGHAKESYHSKRRRVQSGSSSLHTVGSQAGSHAVGEALDDTALHSSSLIDTIQPTQTTSLDDAHMSGPDKVCIPFVLYFLRPDTIGAV